MYTGNLDPVFASNKPVPVTETYPLLSLSEYISLIASYQEAGDTTVCAAVSCGAHLHGMKGMAPCHMRHRLFQQLILV